MMTFLLLLSLSSLISTTSLFFILNTTYHWLYNAPNFESHCFVHVLCFLVMVYRFQCFYRVVSSSSALSSHPQSLFPSTLPRTGPYHCFSSIDLPAEAWFVKMMDGVFNFLMSNQLMTNAIRSTSFNWIFTWTHSCQMQINLFIYSVLLVDQGGALD
eukprot:1140710_1